MHKNYPDHYFELFSFEVSKSALNHDPMPIMWKNERVVNGQWCCLWY